MSVHGHFIYWTDWTLREHLLNIFLNTEYTKTERAVRFKYTCDGGKLGNFKFRQTPIDVIYDNPIS